MSTFTPGPWCLGTDDELMTEGGLIVWEGAEEDGLNVAIAEVFDNFKAAGSNARLIAVAPELYKLALRVLDGLDPLLANHARTVLAEVDGPQ